MLNQTAIDKVVKRIADAGVESAQQFFTEVLRFLSLCQRRPGEAFVPSKAVDEGWHEFVLCTREYTTHCQEYGGYVHHDPTDQPDLGGYQRTRTALIEEFGDVDARFWPDLSAGSCTGSCESGNCKTLLEVGSCTGSCESGNCKTLLEVGGCTGSCESGNCKTLL